MDEKMEPNSHLLKMPKKKTHSVLIEKIKTVLSPMSKNLKLKLFIEK